jgi:hypothetical protein
LIGDDTTIFVNEKDTSAVIAVGYRRVLYGDHGPYVEFTKHQIHWEAWARKIHFNMWDDSDQRGVTLSPLKNCEKVLI